MEDAASVCNRHSDEAGGSALFHEFLDIWSHALGYLLSFAGKICHSFFGETLRDGGGVEFCKLISLERSLDGEGLAHLLIEFLETSVVGA